MKRPLLSGATLLLLIDGYNLLHAAGWACAGLPKGRLEAARRQLIDWLADAPARKSGAARFLVVFDAQKSPHSSPPADHRGVEVRFAHRQTADDLIEAILNDGASRGRVAVVSNDGRLHESARRRGAEGWSCQRFMDWLLEYEGGGGAPEPLPLVEKPVGGETETDREEWLRVFSTPKPKRKR